MVTLFFTRHGSYGLGIARKHCLKGNLHNIHGYYIISTFENAVVIPHFQHFLLIILKITCFRTKLKYM